MTAPPQVCCACGGRPRERFELLPGAPLWQCPHCLLGWWHWPDFSPDHFYNEAYFQGAGVARGYDDYASLEPGLRRTARARLKRLGRLLRAEHSPDRTRLHGAQRRLLELGCGTGTFIEEAQRAGWQAEGVEVSTYAAGVAAARGLNVRVGAIEAQPLAAGAYDAVVLWDVLEHLRDPPAVLGRVAAALRPGGLLALSTGDVTSLCARLCRRRWHLYTLPEHLYFFSPKSLRLLCRAAGLRVVYLRREINWTPFMYLLERLEKSAGLPLGRQWLRGRLDRRERELLIPATLFDVLGLYARVGSCRT